MKSFYYQQGIGMHTHTHARTHAHTQKHTHAHTHVCVHVCVCERVRPPLAYTYSGRPTNS